MGKWTLLDDEEIDNYISYIIKDVVSVVKNSVSPQSLILAGSFGHGEGTVLKNEDKIEILSDFDMTIVKDDYISRGKLEEISKLLARKHSCDITIGRTTSQNHINPPQNNPSWSISVPSTNIYTRKYGAKVVYGEDYIQKMGEVDPKKIRKVDAPRVLFNRMGESLIHISKISSSNYQISNRELFWLTKLVISCMDAYLVCKQSYHYSYAEKLKTFKSLISDEEFFSEIERSNFTNLINDAVNFKLYGKRNSLKSKNSGQYRMEIKKSLDKFTRLIIYKTFNFKFKNYIDFKYKYLTNDLIYDWYRLPSESVYIQNIYYLFELRKKGFGSPVRLGFQKSIPFPHIMYTNVLLSFFSNINSLEKNIKYINFAKIGLSYFNLNKKSIVRDFSKEKIKEETYRLWKILCI